MRQIQLLIILFIFGLSNALAQTNQRPGEVFIQQANFNHSEAAIQFTSDFVSMFDMNFDTFDAFDNSNMAIINLFGNNNISNVTQSGWGNSALVNILGDGNTSGLKQRGSGNQFILNLEGSDNTVQGKQAGHENKLRLDLVGDAQSHLFMNGQSFTQSGNNLSLQVIGNGNSGGVPMQIEQRGNGGAPVIIENY